MKCKNCVPNDNDNKFITQDQKTATTAKVFLITCMDFRLLEDISLAMNSLGYNNNYDQFIVAGASMGVCQKRFPNWGKTCIEHMEIGSKLHDFKKIMVIDHEDCGAYKTFFPELVGNLELERKYHSEYIQKLYEVLFVVFPNMEFQGFLMNLDGNITEVPIDISNNDNVLHRMPS